MDIEFKNKVISATKWSSITEVATRIITPVSNMILARIIAPEAFGVIATITMIISFVEMFSDSGFQKYLVQRNFKDETEKFNSFNVAFWTNLVISIILWLIIILLRDQIAVIVGSPELGVVIAVACLQLPLTSFSSIQMSFYRRNFNFKTLFIVRTISSIVPFVITIPLAFTGLTYWAVLIGTMTAQFLNALILNLKSEWRPSFFYKFKVLKNMLSFSLWSLIESVSIWLSVWIDSFIIGSILSAYYLGLYKTSTSMVNTITALVTASVIPVLFATLSRLQKDHGKFTEIFLKFQRLISIFILPLGVGVFLFSDMATHILLGESWLEASSIIGIWALTRSFKIVLGDLSSEVYRSKGRPKLSFVAQLLHLVVLVPTCIISVKYGFWTLVYSRSLIQLQFILVHLLLIHFIIDINVIKIIKNITPALISALVMGAAGYLFLELSGNILWVIVSVFLCIIVYFTVLSMFPQIRKEFLSKIVTIIFGRIKGIMQNR